MGHRRESVYHEDLVGFLRGERWEQQDIEELEAHAHEGIGVSDERLEDLTRFILLKAEEVAAREQADQAFRVADAGWDESGNYLTFQPGLEA